MRFAHRRIPEFPGHTEVITMFKSKAGFIFVVLGLAGCAPEGLDGSEEDANITSNKPSVFEQGLSLKPPKIEDGDAYWAYSGNARDLGPIAKSGSCSVYAVSETYTPHLREPKKMGEALAEGDCRDACKKWGTSGGYRSYEYRQISGWSQLLWFEDDYYLRFEIPDKAAQCVVSSYSGDFVESITPGFDSGYNTRRAWYEANY